MIKIDMNSKKGITLVTLAVAIIIMLIISTTLIYNISTSSKVRAINNMYQDVTIIKDKVDLYYANHHTIPILETKYENIAHLQSINPNDGDTYYVVDLEALGNLSLTYGQDYKTYKTNPLNELTDLYIINEQSHSIYYAKGIAFEDKFYYTMLEETTKIELNSISTIEIEKIDQNIAVLKLNAINKTNGVKQIKLFINDEEYKTYDYTSNFKEVKTEVLNVTIPFGEELICYIQIADESENVVNSESITLQNYEYISTLDDLKILAGLVNDGTNTFSEKTINLINDIDLEGSETNQWIPIGNEEYAFAGNFEGNGHSIKNIYINTTSQRQGLFGNVNSSEIRNIVLTNGTINALGYAGGIVGRSEDSTIKGCINNANVKASLEQVGGICGRFVSGEIIKCINKGSIVGAHSTGGIAGSVQNSEIASCYNAGKIECLSTGSGNGTYLTGGIVGYSGNKEGMTTTITNCYNIGDVKGYSGVTTSGIRAIGGITATLEGGGIYIINNNYTVGTLSGENSIISGIVANYSNWNGTPQTQISNNYWLSGCGATYGITNSSNNGATPCTEDELKNIATTLGSEYKVDENNINSGYPILVWQD